MRLSPIIAAAALAALPAQAALSPCAYDAAVTAARDVIQVRVQGVETGPVPVEAQPADHVYCSVRGEVVGVFRGGLETGLTVSITRIPCIHSGVPGPVLATSPEALRAAPVIEFHLDGRGEVAGHGAGIVLLQEATPKMAWKPDCG